MASFNRVIIMGNLTRDIELRVTPGGLPVTDIGVAVNDRRKNASGEWVDDVSFVDVTLFGRTAEVASEYLGKGSPIFVEGKLKQDRWEKDGQKFNKLKVIADRMQLIGGAGGGGPRPPAGGSATQIDSHTPSDSVPGNEANPTGSSSDYEEQDIPF
ncbi:MAG: single-stranded DNA-binding protein [Planctomycetota bacterium]